MARKFSETMSALRRERGLSQRTAAADLHISQALLSHYENGAREPGLDFVCRACDYYGVSADYLLTGDATDKDLLLLSRKLALLTPAQLRSVETIVDECVRLNSAQ